MPKMREIETKKRAVEEELTSSHNKPDFKGPTKKQRSERERDRRTLKTQN